MLSPDQQARFDDLHYGIELARRRAKRRVDAEEQPLRHPLLALTLPELFKQPAPQWVIDQWLPELGLIQIVGAPGTLKTFFMLSAGLSVAAGKKEFFGYRVVRQGAVLYVAAEGAGAFQYRIRAWCHEHRVDPLTVPFRVVPAPVNLRDTGSQQELLALVEEMRPVLVVIDTLSRCTPGADENSAREMGEVIAFCSLLQRQSRAAIAFVHHPTKQDPTGGGRGSSVLLGAVDTEIRIDKDRGKGKGGGTPRITVSIAKQKDDCAPPDLELVGHVVPVRHLDGWDMAYESGRPITSLVLRPATPDAIGDRTADAVREFDLRVLHAMQEYPAITSQASLRSHLAVRQNLVSDSVGRILRARWATEGGRGQSYALTELGRRQLMEVEM